MNKDWTTGPKNETSGRQGMMCFFFPQQRHLKILHTAKLEPILYTFQFFFFFFIFRADLKFKLLFDFDKPGTI